MKKMPLAFFGLAGVPLLSAASHLAGAESPLTFIFTPEASGIRTGSISVLTSAPGTPGMIAPPGIGTGQGNIQSSPSSLTFADQVVGTVSAAQTVTLTNISQTPAATAIQTVASGFVSTNNCPAVLDPGTNCQLSIQFAPVSVGLARGTVYAGSVSTITVNGTGIAAGTGGSGITVLSPSALNLGSLLVGTSTSTTTPPTIYLTNAGSVPVTLQSISVALTGGLGSVSDFTYNVCSGASLPYTIAPAAQCNLSIYFTPSTTGTETATITLRDSSGSSPHVATVTGIGLAATKTLEFTPGQPDIF